MKIYVVTSGIYSEYSIEGVFLSKDKAQIFSDTVYGSNGVEEWDTMDDDVQKYIDDNFNIYRTDKHEYIRVIYSKGISAAGKEFEDVSIYITANNHYKQINIFFKKNYITIVRCMQIKYDFNKHKEIKEKAIKVVHDLYAQILALRTEGYSDEQIKEMLEKE